MREKLIGYLINDIAPAVAKNHDPEGTILKFASEHNLATALVETLGQLFNTAKTVAHLEKSASRGSDFPLLDVPQLMAKYLEVQPVKKASIKGESAYDQFMCGSDDLPSFFDNIGVPVQIVKDDVTETPIKSASEKKVQPTRADYRDQSHEAKNYEQLEQARFEFQEDLRSNLTKFAFMVKQAGVPFEQIEADALALNGTEIKSALDHAAQFCTTKFVQVKRASVDTAEKGNRVIQDEHGLLAQLGLIQFDLKKIAAADAALLEKSAAKPQTAAAEVTWGGEHDSPSSAHARPLKPKPREPREQGAALTHTGGKPLTVSHEAEAKPESRQPSTPKSHTPVSESPTYLKTLAGAGSNAISPLTSFPDLKQKVREFMGLGGNDDQRTVDTGYNDAKHLSVLQQLLTSDEVLADADHEKVVSLFNTLRQNAPSVAADPNIAGVALRSMIQHDGISPFDLKGFLDTENAKQKNVMNDKVLDSINYGGAPVQKPNKVS